MARKGNHGSTRWGPSKQGPVSQELRVEVTEGHPTLPPRFRLIGVPRVPTRTQIEILPSTAKPDVPKVVLEGRRTGNEARGIVFFVGLSEKVAEARGTSLANVVQTVLSTTQKLVPEAESEAAVALASADVPGTDLQAVYRALDEHTADASSTAIEEAGHQDRLVRAKVRRDLADLDYRRKVVDASAGGRKQVEIARATGTTQGNVSHLLSPGKRPTPVLRGFHGATPYEVCQRHAAGQLTDDELVNELGRWPYLDADTRTDGYNSLLVPVSGSFDDVDLALDQGLIPEELYGRIYEAIEGR